MKPAQHALKSAPLALAIALAANAGCVASPESTDTTEGPAATAATAPGPLAQRLEQASRQVDVGDGAKAIAELTALRADPAATPEQRDQAALALAHALEAKGDTGAAVQTLSELITQRGNERSWPLQKPAEAALRRILTGSEAAPRNGPPRDNDPTSPFARLLVKYFPEEHGTIHVVVEGFGGSDRASNRIGTFNIAKAIREAREAECPLCDTNLNIWTSLSRSDDWLGILRSGSERQHSVAVYYYASGARRIPAYFDNELPMPVAEVDARIARGEGVVVAKERAGSPPANLIAAPRPAQLDEVEVALSQMKTLPLEPMSVSVSADLRPEEIEQVVRDSRKEQRACYSALLARSPGAAGTITLKLAIDEDGSVGDVSSEPSASVKDPEFVGCMEDVAKKLAFPATGHGGTIVFPVRLASAK